MSSVTETKHTKDNRDSQEEGSARGGFGQAGIACFSHPNWCDVSSPRRYVGCGPDGFDAQATCRRASSRLSHSPIRFQLTKVWLTSLRSAFCARYGWQASAQFFGRRRRRSSLRSGRPRRKQISIGVQRRRASQMQKQNPIARRELLVPNLVNQARHGFAFINRI
jgi:hypothetical protein